MIIKQWLELQNNKEVVGAPNKTVEVAEKFGLGAYLKSQNFSEPDEGISS
jgi:hypothetical protein